MPHGRELVNYSPLLHLQSYSALENVDQIMAAYGVRMDDPNILQKRHRVLILYAVSQAILGSKDTLQTPTQTQVNTVGLLLNRENHPSFTGIADELLDASYNDFLITLALANGNRFPQELLAMSEAGEAARAAVRQRYQEYRVSDPENALRLAFEATPSGKGDGRRTSPSRENAAE